MNLRARGITPGGRFAFQEDKMGKPAPGSREVPLPPDSPGSAPLPRR
jgi:hypothetical protein